MTIIITITAIPIILILIRIAAITLIITPLLLVSLLPFARYNVQPQNMPQTVKQAPSPQLPKPAMPARRMRSIF